MNQKTKTVLWFALLVIGVSLPPVLPASGPCPDVDGDGVTTCAGDCDDRNPRCTLDCLDVDGDGYCIGHDCDDSNAACNADCTDLDGDGLCPPQDCNDMDPSDSDGDNVADSCDNCPTVPNKDQADFDGFRSEQVIAVTFFSLLLVHGSDLDGDDDADVLSYNRDTDRLEWHENSTGTGSFAPPRLIDVRDFIASLTTEDLDRDGDPDILTGTVPTGVPGTVGWYENLDGAGTFGARQPIPGSLTSNDARAADLDGDGDPDIASATLNDIVWHENQDGVASYGPALTLPSSVGPRALCLADIDGDGDIDITGASVAGQGQIAWHENLDGAGNFSGQITIAPNADDPIALACPDVDGDGDIDLVSASLLDDQIGWYRNLNGGGAFSLKTVISTEVDGPRDVVAEDLDGDGDVDVASSSALDTRTAWYANENGAGSFGAQILISGASGGLDLDVSDLDGDGYGDILTSTANSLVWFPSLGDGAGDACDNCPRTLNADQVDADLDGFGAACDCADNNATCAVDCPDADSDGVPECDDCDDLNPGCNVDCTDADSDGFCVGTDCDETNPETHPGAVEVNDGVTNQCPGDPGFDLTDETSGISGFFDKATPTQYSWPPQAGATLYEVARSGFSSFQPTCTSVTTSTPSVLVTGSLSLGGGEFILNRPVAPNPGSWGATSDGTERVIVCP